MKILITFILCITASAVISHFVWPKRVLETEHSIDTVFVSHVIHDTLRGKIRVIRQKEKVNIDSLWNEALEYAMRHTGENNREGDIKEENNNADDTAYSAAGDILSNYSFEAEADSTYKDSIITAKVIYHSPLPLHPKSYFIMDFRYKEKTILETHQKELNFFDRFRYSINAGLGYGIINKKMDFYIGAGGSFNF